MVQSSDYYLTKPFLKLKELGHFCLNEFTNSVPHDLMTHAGFCFLQVRFHPLYPNLLASGSLDHEVRLWDANTAECIGSRDFCNYFAD